MDGECDVRNSTAVHRIKNGGSSQSTDSDQIIKLCYKPATHSISKNVIKYSIGFSLKLTTYGH